MSSFSFFKIDNAILSTQIKWASKRFSKSFLLWMSWYRFNRINRPETTWQTKTYIILLAKRLSARQSTSASLSSQYSYANRRVWQPIFYLCTKIRLSLWPGANSTRSFDKDHIKIFLRLSSIWVRMN